MKITYSTPAQEIQNVYLKKDNCFIFVKETKCEETPELGIFSYGIMLENNNTNEISIKLVAKISTHKLIGFEVINKEEFLKGYNLLINNINDNFK